ncbi:MAG: hypothetical protein VX891_00865, partial [Candidatus Thermoplasmatota archaeon]|nr:hypothetical protein [Candidatus Thermoplasmatota archaeon]
MVRLTVRVGQSDVASVCRHALAVLLADAADVVAPPKLRLAGVGLHQHLLDLCASLLLEDKGLLPAVLHVCEHVVVLKPHFVPTDAPEALAAEEPLAVDGGARFEEALDVLHHQVVRVGVGLVRGGKHALERVHVLLGNTARLFAPAEGHVLGVGAGSHDDHAVVRALRDA